MRFQNSELAFYVFRNYRYHIPYKCGTLTTHKAHDVTGQAFSVLLGVGRYFCLIFINFTANWNQPYDTVFAFDRKVIRPVFGLIIHMAIAWEINKIFFFYFIKSILNKLQKQITRLSLK